MQTIYPKGISIFPKHPNSPDFVKAKLSLNKNIFNESFLSEYEKYFDEKGYLSVDVLDGKTGLYLKVNTYVYDKNKKTENVGNLTNEQKETLKALNDEHNRQFNEWNSSDGTLDNIPF